MRSANDIVYGLTQAYEFFEPAIVFIYTQLNNFLAFIEQRWYLMFVWLLLNAGFCFWVVGRSLFDWSDIITDGLVRGALLSRIKANRLEEAEERYQKRKAINRAEAEERYLERKEENKREREELHQLRLLEAEERYQKRKEEREAERSRARLERESVLDSRSVAIGEEYTYEGEDLARAYFDSHPNSLHVKIGKVTYTNYGYLNRLYEDIEEPLFDDSDKALLVRDEYEQLVKERARSRVNNNDE